MIESEMPVSKVSETLGVTANRVWRVFDYWIEKSYTQDDLSEVRRIGVDETSRKKEHNYITQFVDLDAKRTVFVTEGNDSSTIESFVEELEKNQAKRKT
jgi:transposase